MYDSPAFLSRPIGRDWDTPRTLPVPGSTRAMEPIALSFGATVMLTALLIAFCMRTSMDDLIVSPPRSRRARRSSTVAPRAGSASR